MFHVDDTQLTDMSAGRWRGPVLGHDAARWPPVQPQHERIKYLANAGPFRTIGRFAGLGRVGAAKYTRACQLEDAGFGAPVGKLSNGWLSTTWLDGSPHKPATMAAPPLVDRVARYLAFVRNTFETGEPENVGELQEMVRVNVGEALGPQYAATVDSLCAAASTFAEPRVTVDGRLLAHEWIDTTAGPTLKVDALDHSADDFLPGCRDIAWDVAGAITELQLNEEAARALMGGYATATSDRTIADRIEFYLIAYAAYRVGYTSLAADSMGDSADSTAFRQSLLQYRRSLAALLDRPHRSPRY
jgi:hypothetical protein